MPTGWGGNPKDFLDHYKRHAKNIGAESPKEYVDKAKDFHQQFQDEKLPAVQNEAGYMKVYDPQTNTFGVYMPDGDPIILYKPTSPTYFERETQNVLDNGGKVINPLPSESGSGGGSIGGGGLGPQIPGNLMHHLWDIEE